MSHVLLIDPEAGAVGVSDHRPLHDGHTGGTAVGHVEEVAVDGTHNVETCALFGILRMLRGLCHGPVAAGLDCLNIIVAVSYANLRVASQLHFHNVSHLLPGQFLVVCNQLILRDIRCKCIRFFGDLHHAVIGRTIRFCRQKLQRDHRKHGTQHKQQRRNSFLHVLLHVLSSFRAHIFFQLLGIAGLGRRAVDDRSRCLPGTIYKNTCRARFS